jgi:asparagine synthase (glutamine-hydrolysing)
VLTEGGKEPKRYWRPDRIAVETMSVEVAKQRLEHLLTASVSKQIQADVPVGVFTSGGVDSALLASLAAAEMAPEALCTFAVGFSRPSFDERSQAARVSRRLGARHFEVCADEPALAKALDHVTDRVAEPIADPAILPTYLLAQRAREHVGVVLSGEGADELFGGYPTYLGHRLAPHFSTLPPWVRSGLTTLSEFIPPSHSKVPLEFLIRRFVADADQEVLSRHVRWFGTGLRADIIGGPGKVDVQSTWLESEPDPLRQIMLFDYRTYLTDDLLAKVDRATMLASLEARSPYLDRDVTTFGLALDPTLKVRGLQTKWLLKRVAKRWLPPRVVRRRKRGLSVPVGTWINEGLRAEVDRLLAIGRLQTSGILNAATVGRLLFEHRSGQANHGRALWAVLVFERWRERWAEA